MKYLLVIISVILLSTHNAQSVDLQVIGSVGGSYADSNIEVDYTAGEAVIETVSSGPIVLTQGFHQPGYGLTGLEEVVVNSEISLYPNPVNNELNISFNEINDYSGNVTVNIYDTQGKLMMSEVYNVNSGIVQMDLSSLGTGHYLVQVQDSDGMISRAQIVKY